MDNRDYSPSGLTADTRVSAQLSKKEIFWIVSATAILFPVASPNFDFNQIFIHCYEALTCIYNISPEQV